MDQYGCMVDQLVPISGNLLDVVQRFLTHQAALAQLELNTSWHLQQNVPGETNYWGLSTDDIV